MTDSAASNLVRLGIACLLSALLALPAMAGVPRAATCEEVLPAPTGSGPARNFTLRFDLDGMGTARAFKVYRRDTLVQTLELQDKAGSPAPEAGCSTCCKGRTLSWDLDFDGQPEIGFMVDNSLKSRRYEFWAFNPGSNRFEYAGALDNPSLDRSCAAVLEWKRLGQPWQDVRSECQVRSGRLERIQTTRMEITEDEEAFWVREYRFGGGSDTLYSEKNIPVTQAGMEELGLALVKAETLATVAAKRKDWKGAAGAFGDLYDRFDFPGTQFKDRPEWNKAKIAWLNDYGFYLDNAGDTLKAIEVLCRVIRLDSTRTPAYLNLADAQSRLKGGTGGGADPVKLARYNYGLYAARMRAAGKAGAIPARVKRISAGKNER